MTAIDTATATTAQSAGTAAQNNTSSQANASVISSDFDTFLRMLTAQLENQDPLNPMESQDFAVQLATFSNVEQQTRTNTLLEDLAAQLGASGLQDMSAWLGKEAKVTGDIPFNGAPVTLYPTPVDGAVESILIVTDASGNQVASYEMEPGSDTGVIWEGYDDEGYAVPYGTYSFTIVNTPAEEDATLPNGTIHSYLPVTEVRSEPQGMVLLLDGDFEVSPDAVEALRQPAG